MFDSNRTLRKEFQRVGASQMAHSAMLRRRVSEMKVEIQFKLVSLGTPFKCLLILLACLL